MKKYKSLLIYILTIIVSAAVGGVFGGFFSSSASDSFIRLINQAGSLIGALALPMQIAITSGLFFISLGFYFKGKARAARCSDEDEAGFDQADKELGIAVSISGIAMITSFIFFGIFLAAKPDLEVNLIPIGIGAAFLMCSLLILTAFQAAIIKQIKALYPEKRGDVLEFRFQKDWLESSDEAERYVIFRAAYTAYMFMQKAFLICLVILMVSTFQFDVGILPFLMLGGLWLTQMIVYSVKATKASAPSSGKS